MDLTVRWFRLATRPTRSSPPNFKLRHVVRGTPNLFIKPNKYIGVHHLDKDDDINK